MRFNATSREKNSVLNPVLAVTAQAAQLVLGLGGCGINTNYQLPNGAIARSFGFGIPHSPKPPGMIAAPEEIFYGLIRRQQLYSWNVIWVAKWVYMWDGCNGTADLLFAEYRRNVGVNQLFPYFWNPILHLLMIF